MRNHSEDFQMFRKFPKSGSESSETLRKLSGNLQNFLNFLPLRGSGIVSFSIDSSDDNSREEKRIPRTNNQDSKSCCQRLLASTKNGDD
jgi:hypothetical protein